MEARNKRSVVVADIEWERTESQSMQQMKRLYGQSLEKKQMNMTGYGDDEVVRDKRARIRMHWKGEQV